MEKARVKPNFNFYMRGAGYPVPQNQNRPILGRVPGMFEPNPYMCLPSSIRDGRSGLAGTGPDEHLL